MSSFLKGLGSEDKGVSSWLELWGGGVSRKSRDLHAQAGHIGELVKIKVMAQLPLEGYSSLEVQSAERLNTTIKNKTKNLLCIIAGFCS